MGIEPVNDMRQPPRLRAVEGKKRDQSAEETPRDRVEIGADEHDGEADVRPAKVAEARIKIMNDYYSRRDIQLELAERLILELGA